MAKTVNCTMTWLRNHRRTRKQLLAAQKRIGRKLKKFTVAQILARVTLCEMSVQLSVRGQRGAACGRGGDGQTNMDNPIGRVRCEGGGGQMLQEIEAFHLSLLMWSALLSKGVRDHTYTSVVRNMRNKILLNTIDILLTRGVRVVWNFFYNTHEIVWFLLKFQLVA